MKFDVYTYQFQRINAPAPGTDLFDGEGMRICSDEEWANKQALFGRFFEEDKNKKKPFQVVNADGEIFVHKTHFCNMGIILLRVEKRKVISWNDIDNLKRQVDTTPASYVLIDNRDGIQRMLIQRTNATWTKTTELMKILCHTFDNLMLQHGMHFVMGDTPVYRYKSVWDVVDASPMGISHMEFNFPAPNLGRLANMADVLIATRVEAEAAIDTRIVAPEGGAIKLKKGGHIDSMIQLSSAEGSIVKVKRRGENIVILIGGNEENAVTLEISEDSIKDLTLNKIFTGFAGDLLGGLNSLKTVYE